MAAQSVADDVMSCRLVAVVLLPCSLGADLAGRKAIFRLAMLELLELLAAEFAPQTHLNWAQRALRCSMFET